MSILIQRSVFQQFTFNGKNVRSVHVKDVGQCLVSSDVYRAVCYDGENGENGKKAGVQAMQLLVPEKYKMRFGDADVDLQGVLKSEYLHPDTVLLKEPGLYCFLLRCKRVEAEPFMEWAVETVRPREVRKLSKQLVDQQQSIEEKDTQHHLVIDAERHKVLEKYNAIALLNDDLEDRDRQIVVRNQETVMLNGRVEELENRAVPYLEDARKDNGMAIIQKNNDDEYPYIAICWQQGYVAQKIKNKLADYPNGHLLVLAETPNAIVHYNWLREQGSLVANPDRVLHFRLGEHYTHQRLMELREA